MAKTYTVKSALATNKNKTKSMYLESHNFLLLHLSVSFYSFKNSILGYLDIQEQYNSLYIHHLTIINL